ncbi:MAG: thioredoxin [Oribacterium sp.]|nr:thioredoxin [Oribacterium sp.]
MEYKFTKDNFQKEVLESDIPVLVDFYADWCGPCKMMFPIVEALAEQYDGKIKIGKVNSDEEMDLATSYQVRSIPSFFIIKDGKVVENIVGAISKEALEEKLNKLI